MSTCSLARKPRRGTLGPRVLVPHPAPPDPKKSLEAGGSLYQSRLSRVSPASQHPPVRAAVPKKNTSPEGIRGCSATSHRPGLWNAHRRRVVRTEIPRAVGWKEVEPGALKWLPLARPRPGRALGSGKTQKMGNIRACHCAVPGVSGGASGGSLLPLSTVHSRSLVLILVP